MGEGDGPKWYAVRVRGQQKQVVGVKYRANPADAPFIVEHWLQQRGFETFVPRRKVFRFVNGTGKRKREKVEKAFQAFVGWMFVRLDLKTQYHDLISCPGVSGLAPDTTGQPGVINEAALRQLAKKLGDGLLTAPERERYMRTHKEFAPGSMAKVAEGSLAELMVKVVKVEGRIAKVLLPMFGKESVVEIDAMLLEAA